MHITPTLEATLKPSSLQPGDTIAIVAPAKPVDGELVERCVAYLKDQGYGVRTAANLGERLGYLAGEDQARADAFMDCWCDPDVKMVWCIAGGYGCTRILSLLDFERMRAFPKIFLGMSDVTALHVAIRKELDLVTFLGPNAGFLCAEGGTGRRYARDGVWRCVTEGGSLKGIVSDSGGYTLRPGKGCGRLVGGNLALICALMGTPWQLETAGTILLLEDVNEEPYRIDRMLQQLMAGGLLDKVSGVILSSFYGCEAGNPSRSLTLEQIFAHYFSEVSYPVWVGFPSGHIDRQATLPLNAEVELDADAGSLQFLESFLN